MESSLQTQKYTYIYNWSDLYRKPAGAESIANQNVFYSPGMCAHDQWRVRIMPSF